MRVDASIAVGDVVFDESIYPRSNLNQPTVDRYAESLECGDVFPPIVLEPETNRLWDGAHRWHAHKQAGLDTIDVVFESCPDGVPEKLFAASFSVKHGDRIPRADLRALAREILVENPKYNNKDIAARCGVSMNTLTGWLGDLNERFTLVRVVQAQLLLAGGWTQERAGEALGVAQQTITNDSKIGIACNFAAYVESIDATHPDKRLHIETFVREAAKKLPDNDLDLDTLIDNILYAEEEAAAREFLETEDPDLAAKIPTTDLPNFRTAKAVWEQKHRQEAHDIAQQKKAERERAAAEKQNHEARVKSVLGSLTRLEGMQHETWRRDTMESIRKHPEAAPPTQHHCHTPQYLRQLAEWITTYADELEASL